MTARLNPATVGRTGRRRWQTILTGLGTGALFLALSVTPASASRLEPTPGPISDPALAPTCEDLPSAADPAATPATVTLLENLYVHAGERTLYGQQNDLSLAADDDVVSGVREAAGSFPALFGWDIGGLELKGDNEVYGSAADQGRPQPLAGPASQFVYDGQTADGIGWDELVQLIKRADELGGITTLTWSAPNPITYQRGPGNTYPGSVAAVLPGGQYHDRFVAWLDTIAAFDSELVDAAGQAIPIIFRPWHEHSADWYWWGIGGGSGTAASADQFVELWRFTVDYLGSVGVHNFLYAYSPDRSSLGDPMAVGSGPLDDEAFGRAMATDWPTRFWTAWSNGFPGQDVVDIYGLDNYWDSGAGYEFHPYRDDQTKLDELWVSTADVLARQARQDGKLAAITQTDQGAGRLVSLIRQAGVDSFGQTYAAAADISYVLHLDGLDADLGPLAADSPSWFASATEPFWREPVACGPGALGVAFDARSLAVETLDQGAVGNYIGSAQLPGIRITDTRSGGPGWDATITSASTLSGPEPIDATVLGLAPLVVQAGVGQIVEPGPVIAAGTGFVGGTPLAHSPAGSSRGLAVLGGELSYTIPTWVEPGNYRVTLTVTVF